LAVFGAAVAASARRCSAITSGNAIDITALRPKGGSPPMEIDKEAATATSPPSAQAIAALGMAASLMESLLRGGLIDKEAFDAIVKDAASYVQALCTDCPSEVEREAQAMLKLLGKPPADVPPFEATASA
jgi:hypothetical protein